MGLLRGSEFQDEYGDWLEHDAPAAARSWLDFPVGDLEHGPLLKVVPQTSLREVMTLMNEHHRGAVLVVHRDELIGIFTERDVLTRVFPSGLNVDHTPVFELMTRNPEVLHEWATLGQALRVMTQGGFRHLPVVDSRGRAVSMVSMRSIIEFVCDAFPNEVLNTPPDRWPVFTRVEGG